MIAQNAQTTHPASVMEGNRYTWYGPNGDKFVDIMEPSGTFYREGTPREVINALDSCIGTRKRVRLFLGDKETGRDWLEEFDVLGYVSRSMGPIRIPILIANSRSHGGAAISVDAIVRLLVNGVERYRHPRYTVPDIGIRHCEEYEYPFRAYVNGEAHASFISEARAERWKAFLTGNRMGK